MKIVVIGGHFTPALAVIEKLKGHDILYVGRKHALEGDMALSLEYREINALKIPFKSIVAARLQRKFTIFTIPSLLKIPIGFVQSLFILKKFKPNAVLGFGGYVEVPVIAAAVILRIPVVIHEQTLYAGLANKIVSRFTRKICIAWESSLNYFPKNKTILTGNPIRSEIINAKKETKNETDQKLIYITGGSLGSHAINLLAEGSLNRLLKNYRIIHQTGDSKEFRDFERLTFLREDLDNKNNYLIKKFLSAKETAEILANADLIVGRSGMNTITELIFLKKPCLLIPLPHGSEQKENAEFVKKLGLAEVAYQSDLTPTKFVEAINVILKNINNYKVSEDLLIGNAPEKIAEAVLHESSKT